MNITIVGCGYVGKAAAELWQRKGHRITATTRKPERQAELSEVADSVYVIPETGNLRPALEGADGVLLAVAADTRTGYADTYLKTSRTLIKSMAQIEQTPYLLYTSSTSVYGDHAGGWVTEDRVATEPLNENSAILIETEQVLLEGPCPCAIFRLGGIIGPGRDIAQRLHKMQGTVLPGNGDRYLNLIHRDTIVSALDFALEHRLEGIYNLCSDDHPRRREHYDQLCEAAGLPLFEWDPTQLEPHPGDKRVSNAKIKAAGFQFNSKGSGGRD